MGGEITKGSACANRVRSASVPTLNLPLRAGTEATAPSKGSHWGVTRPRRRSSWWWLSVLSVLVAGGGLVLLAQDGTPWQVVVTGQLGSSAVMAATLPLIAAALRVRAPGNRLAAVLLLTGLSRAGFVLAVGWGGIHDPLADRPGAAVASWIALSVPFVALALAPLMLLWFPDGQLPDGRRRWRVAEGFTLLALCALAALLALTWRYRGAALLDDASPPEGVQGRLAVAALVTVIVSCVCGLGAGALSLFARWRSEHGVVRQQLKWYLAGAVAAIALNAAGDVVPTAGWLNLLGALCLEAAILIAVLRHNLWDIDRILNRTVVYGTLSAVLAAIYVGSVLALGVVLDDLNQGGAIAIAASTLAVASVAAPTRRRLQRRVDRRFDRRTFDAVSRIQQHASKASVSPPTPGETEALLSAVLRDPRLHVLYRCQDGLFVDAWGHPCDRTVPDGLTGTPVGQPDHEDALVIHAPIATHEAALWQAVLRAARPCLSQARLQAEVLVQLAAVQRSRNRIVEASDAERRRIERNLHDGAQQRLVSLALRMRTEQRRHAPTLGPEAMRIIDEAVDELRGSVEDLRALAAGLLPGSLVSEGLGPALQEMALRHPQGVRVLNALNHRHSQSVEEVAWFVAAEGVANAVKHASQARVCIEVGCAAGSLSLLVRDDGAGGAVEGAGLIGLQDRVRACSGALELRSPSGDGTTLTVVLPCA